MADFTRAFAKTLGHEGGYSNDPSDRGGETFMGITRRDHPDWPGWRIVDDAHGDDAALVTRMPQLRQLAADLYKRRYWDRLDGDSIQSQPVAEKLFDLAVNMGVGRAVTFLQRALNVLNRGGTLYPDVATDGDCGPRTREALASYLSHDKDALLLNAIRALQAAFYIDIMTRDPSQERFARGWLSRAFADIA